MAPGNGRRMWSIAITIATMAGSLGIAASPALADDPLPPDDVVVAPVPDGFAPVPGRPDAVVDGDGNVFRVEESTMAPGRSVGAAAPPAPLPASETFHLHSKPGASKIFHLDFDGYTSATESDLPFDTDGSPASFGPSEVDTIQEVWARVAEMFVTFDVDVTTEDPGTDALLRSSASDPTFGSRMLITNGPASFDTSLANSCGSGCLGMAWVGGIGAFDVPGIVMASNHPVGDVKMLASTVAHELGHTIGLDHQDASPTFQLMLPVMVAVSLQAPLEHWVASASQDDLQLMNGVLGARADDHGDTPATADALDPAAITATGIISDQGDADRFRLDVPAGAGPVDLAIAPTAANRMLDIDATVLDATEQVVAASNPPSSRVDDDIAVGRSAEFRDLALSPGTYYVVVRGSGGVGYSPYGSIGTYTITGRLGLTACLPGYFSATGTAPCTTAPAGFYVDVAGATSATPCSPGTFNDVDAAASCRLAPIGTYVEASGQVAAVACPNGTTTESIGSTSIDDCFAVPSLSGVPDAATVGTPYSFGFTVAGTPAPTVSASPAQLPPGLVLSPTGVLSGVPTSAGDFTFTVTATNGRIPDATLLVTVHVARAAQTVSFSTTPPANALVGGSYTPGAVSTAGLPVSITVDPTSIDVCTITAGTVSFIGTGTCVLAADQAGSADVTPALQAQQSVVVSEAPEFTLASPALSATAGQPYASTFQATGTPTPTLTLAAGAPAWLSITSGGTVSGTPPSGITTFTYTVTATSTAGTASAGPFTVAVAAAPVASTKADLAIVLTCPSTARRSTNVTCTITVRNIGPATAKNVVTAVALPAGATLVSSTRSATCQRNFVVTKTASLASGAVLTTTVVYRTSHLGRTRVGAATISSNPDPNPWNNGAIVTQTITR